VESGDRYPRLVEWSDEDRCFIGSCPGLFYGGCHGSDPRAVFAELTEMVEECLALYHREGRPLPPPASGRKLLDELQREMSR
jgi:predicted RNase H-like HicB family nuclease